MGGNNDVQEEKGTAVKMDADVIIVGQGPVGASMAHALAEHGLSVLAFEKDPIAPYWAPRAVGLDEATIRGSRLLGETINEWLSTHVEMLGEIEIRDGLHPISKPYCHPGSVPLFSMSGNDILKRRDENMKGKTYFLNSFHQPSYEAELRRCLGLRPNVKTLYEHSVSSVKNIVGAKAEKLSYCEVRASPITKNSEECTYRARYVIAADGGSSKIRSGLGIKFQGNTYMDTPWLVIDVEITDMEYLAESWLSLAPYPIFNVGERPFVFIRTSAFFEEWWAEATEHASNLVPEWNLEKENKVYCRNSEPTSEFRQLWKKERLKFIQEKLKAYKGNTAKGSSFLPPRTSMRFEILVKPEEISTEKKKEDFLLDENVKNILNHSCGVDMDRVNLVRKLVYTFHVRTAEKWRSGNIFLVGDAAHCMPPFQGQGMNSGIRDIYNLAWKLSFVLKGKANSVILDTYETERRKNLEDVFEATVCLGVLQKLDHGVPYTLRPKKIKMICGRTSIPKLVDAAVLSPKYHRLNGTLVPCPTLQHKEYGDIQLDALLNREGYSLILCTSTKNSDEYLLDKELLKMCTSRGMKVLQVRLNDAETKKDHQPDITNTHEILYDQQDFFSKWAKRNKVVNKVLVVRPDQYVFGVYSLSSDNCIEAILMDVQDSLSGNFPKSAFFSLEFPSLTMLLYKIGASNFSLGLFIVFFLWLFTVLLRKVIGF